MGPEATRRFDVTFRLEGPTGKCAASDSYIPPMASLAEAERPNRKSIASIRNSFEVAQLAELGGAEQPSNWFGASDWRAGTRRIRGRSPLLERLVKSKLMKRRRKIRLRLDRRRQTRIFGPMKR